jgi:hypothetical protein
VKSRESKSDLRGLRDADERATARARLRHPREDISYRGAGLLRVRLLRVPSFDRTVAWEIREMDGGLLLFRSASPQPDQYLLTDHVRFDAPSEALHALVDPLRLVVMPVFPIVAPVAIADGTRIEIHVGVGFGTFVHAAWPEDAAPPEWGPLARTVGQMLTRFETFQSAEPSLEHHRADDS